MINHVQINLVIHELGWKCEDSNCFEFGICEYDDFDKCLENEDYQWSCHMTIDDHLCCCKPEDIIEDNIPKNDVVNFFLFEDCNLVISLSYFC